MNKKFLIAIAALIILVIIYVIFRSNTMEQTPVVSIDTQTPKEITPAVTIDEKIFFPELISSHNAIFYLGDQGIIFKKYSLDTKQIEKIYPDEVLDIYNVDYSQEGQKAIIKTLVDGKLSFKLIDFNIKSLTNLDENIFDAKWLDHNNLIYSISDAENNKSTIYKVAIGDQNKEKLTEIDTGSVFLQISPDMNWVLIYSEPEGYGENEIYLFNIPNKKLSKLSDKSIVGSKFSPDSKQFITNKYNNNGAITDLLIFDSSHLDKENIQLKADINQTVWISNNQLVAAVNDSNGDQFYLLTSKGRISKLTINSQDQSIYPINARNLMITSDSKSLYFTSNDYLYVLAL